MKLEIGKRYVRRDGVVTSPIKDCNSITRIRQGYVFFDELHGLTYMVNGVHYEDQEGGADLVSEYTESAPVNKFEQRLAACEAKQAEHDAMLARCAALLGLSDQPKAEQPEPPVRYFYQNKTLWRIEENGFGCCRNENSKAWFPAGANLEILTQTETPEITAEQAEAILKGGGL